MLNENHRKAITVFLLILVTASFVIYVISPPIDLYEGWLIRQNDEMQYEVTVDINAGDTFVADILDDYGIGSNTYFGIRVAETPSIINITEICVNLLNFSGVVQVEQQVGQEWVLRNSSLPFFLPTGYWDEINETLNQANGINLVLEWWGEMSITTSIDSQEFGVLDYFIDWEREDGVLQGMTMNATSDNGWDFIRLSLSSLHIGYWWDISYYLQILNRNVPLQILLFGSVVPLFILAILWRPEIRKHFQNRPLNPQED